ncbi:MAG: elongation factor P [Candidatus Omnitrophota bacterium]
MFIGPNQFKNGLTVTFDGQIFAIVSYQFVKPGKGGAFVRTKLRNLKNGNFLEKTFRTEEKVEQAFIEEKKMQYLYRQGDTYNFMDQETFEQTELHAQRLEEKSRFLKNGVIISLYFYKDEIIDINLPNFVELAVADCEPGTRSDTVKATSKNATLETGATLAVPIFINRGDILKIDTRTGEYVGRV